MAARADHAYVPERQKPSPLAPLFCIFFFPTAAFPSTDLKGEAQKINPQTPGSHSQPSNGGDNRMPLPLLFSWLGYQEVHPVTLGSAWSFRYLHWERLGAPFGLQLGLWLCGWALPACLRT